MKLTTEPYSTQVALWPQEGQHILAHFDEETIVVYQAYRPSIARYAVTHQHFGGEFSFNRMSWIKPNFLWMMYRSGWGRKEGQEVTLAIWLQRAAFDAFLAEAVPSSFDSRLFSSPQEWSDAIQESQVRLQWDPDHGPGGAPLRRRALQLGLRGDALASYARGAIVEVEDISPFVAEQAEMALQGAYDGLMLPRERAYPGAT